MTVMHLLMSRSGFVVRKAAAILAATQIMVVAIPLSESGSGSASAHVESRGVQIHYAHNEESCIACAALKVFDGALPAAPPVALSDGSAAAIAATDTFDPRLASGPPRSRAPPSTLVG